MHLAITSESAWTAAPRFALTGSWLPPAGHLSGMCTCGCGGECDEQHGLAGLGDSSTLTPQAAVSAALAAYSGKNLNMKSSIGSAWISDAVAAVESASIPVSPPFGPNCAGVTAQNVNLFQTASGIALGTTAAGVGILAAVHVIPALAVPVVGWVVAGVGALITLIDAIFAHHAAAVKRDLAFGCGSLPAVNNAFQVLAQGISNKTISPDQAAQAVWEIYSNFMQAGGAGGSSSGPGSIPSGGQAINDSPYCNSNCELSIVVYAMALYWGAQYSAMAAAAAPASAASSGNVITMVPSGGSYVATPGTPAPAASSGISPLFLVAAAVAAWAVLR